MTDHTAGQREPSAPSRGSVANRDAVPAAIAPADSHEPRGAVDRESVGTDKAEPLNRDCGTGNTNARLAALEELVALEQELELTYGLTGNPMIKAQERTRPTQTTQGDGSKPQDGTSEPVAWWVRGCEYDTGCEYEFVALLKEQAELAATQGGKAVPLYRSPTLTIAEWEAVARGAELADHAGEHSTTAAALRALLKRLK